MAIEGAWPDWKQLLSRAPGDWEDMLQPILNDPQLSAEPWYVIDLGMHEPVDAEDQAYDQGVEVYNGPELIERGDFGEVLVRYYNCLHGEGGVGLERADWKFMAVARTLFPRLLNDVTRLSVGLLVFASYLSGLRAQAMKDGDADRAAIIKGLFNGLRDVTGTDWEAAAQSDSTSTAQSIQDTQRRLLLEEHARCLCLACNNGQAVVQEKTWQGEQSWWHYSPDGLRKRCGAESLRYHEWEREHPDDK